MRDSCYHCHFVKGNHNADITIGDFHDIDRYVRKMNRFDGISTVIINTDKGSRTWECCVNKLESYDMDILKLKNDNCIYTGGTKEPKQRNIFIDDIENLDFDEVIEKWFNSKNEWKKEIYYHFPGFIRNLIKSIAGL